MGPKLASLTRGASTVATGARDSPAKTPQSAARWLAAKLGPLRTVRPGESNG